MDTENDSIDELVAAIDEEDSQRQAAHRTGAAPSPVPNPHKMGFTPRAARIERAYAQLQEQVRVEIRLGAPPLDEDEIAELASERLTTLLRTEDDEVYKHWKQLAPAFRAPRRDEIEPLAEVLAMRRTSYVQFMEERLTRQGEPRGRGRPSDRRLPLAVFERQIFEKGRPEVRRNVRDFLGCDLLLDHVYGHPVTGSSCGVAQNSVTATMKGMLDHPSSPPLLAMHVNTQVVADLAARAGSDNDYYALDGTHAQAPAEQVPGRGAEHEALIRRGMQKATFATHGEYGTTWRGPNNLTLTRLGETVPAFAQSIPGNEREHKHVIELVAAKFALDPGWTPKAIIADREFDYPELHRVLQERFGIPLITPARRQGSGPPIKTGELGTPTCSCHGATKLMRLVQSDNFRDVAWRRAQGIAPGVRVCHKASKARHRWVCPHPGCDNKEARWFHQAPHRHCYFPFEGEHRGRGGSRIALRIALMMRRTVAESINSTLKHYGAAGRGVEIPRWVSSDAQMEWLLYGSALAITLRRLVHANGAYEAAHRELVDAGLLKLTGRDGQGRAGLNPAAAVRPRGQGAGTDAGAQQAA